MKPFATRKSFYRALNKAANKFKWSVTLGGMLRGMCDSREFCPITAVHYYKTGQFVYVGDVDKCPEVTEDDRGVIVCAADDAMDYLDTPEKIARQALLRAVGLGGN